MSFTRSRLYAKKRYQKKKKSFKILKYFLLYSFLGGVLLVIGGGFYIYNTIIKDLPDVAQLENMTIAESSIIYDRNGKKLYTLSGDEKRTYVGFDQISPNMINAIIAGEDKRFWENPGVDVIGLVRSGVYGVMGKRGGFAGTSTLTQQLIRNTIIENRSSKESIKEKMERKIKEIFLAYKLTNEASKEKIIELYLNQIGFGSNSYGIEQASLTFFGKKAIDLDILQASMLASLPKGPTSYSPYNYYDRLVGNLYVYTQDEEGASINLIKPQDLEEYSELVDEYKDFISNLKASRVGDNGLLVCNLDKNIVKKTSIDKDGCRLMDYSNLLNLLSNISISQDEIVLSYQTGRKDFILQRMLEDEYITFDEYKEALLTAIGFEFTPYREDIKAPHFVMYIKQYLAEKYGEELLTSGGLQIYTTLDYDMQIKAQETLQAQVASNLQKFDANNAALISLDNTNGDIVIYIGGADYFNKDIDGNVDMITSKRQPGSSFKPYVYALAIDKNPIGTQTPIFDVRTNFSSDYAPNNYDGKFNGKMTISTALNYSRNIPAVKLYYLAGEQEGIIEYLEKAGVTSLDPDFYYGSPLALGTGEMTPLEAAGAYSVFANLGQKVEINPILKILDSEGNIIEIKEKSTFTPVLDEATAYILNSILSDSSARPGAFWNANLTLNGRKAGAKTGTSNKSFIINGKKTLLPGDVWTAGYTPQYTTIVWAGNTDGKALNAGGEGISGAAPVWKKVMDMLHEGKEALIWKEPEGVHHATVSKISGLLAPEGFDPALTTSGMFKNLPTEYDRSLELKEVDALCDGKVGPNTPEYAIKTGYYIEYHAIDQTRANWEEGVQKWAKENGLKEFGNIGNILSAYKDEECVRDPNAIANANITIGADISDGETFVTGYNYIDIGFQSGNPVIKVQVILDGKVLQDIPINNKKVDYFGWGVTIPENTSGTHTLTLRAIDSIYVAKEENYSIEVLSSKDTDPPVITITNPENGSSITLYEDQYFNLRGTIEDRSKIRSINIYLDGASLKKGLEGREFVYEINRDTNLSVGMHLIKIEAIDSNFNTGNAYVTLEILPR